jgi:hypothetical protein
MGMSDFRSLASAPLSSHTTARSWRVGASLISQTKAGRRFASQPVRISRRYEQVATSWWILNQTDISPTAAELVQPQPKSVAARIHRVGPSRRNLYERKCRSS